MVRRMWLLNKQHWRIWYNFEEFQAEAKELANATGYEILSRPWDGGWVVFNLRNLFGLAAEREADEHFVGQRYQEAIADYECVEEYDELTEALMELDDDFDRSAEDGWFYQD